MNSALTCARQDYSRQSGRYDPQIVEERSTRRVSKGVADDRQGATGFQGSELGGTPVTTREIGAPQGPVMNLRGARVDADARRVGRVVGGACLVALAGVTIVLFLAGAQKNSEITRLRQQGVVVEVTVSGCRGLMGGSGSNLVGYQCAGTFKLDGHRYREAIPGTSFYRPGAALRVVTVPGDPALVSTVRAVATERSSTRVFVIPAILLVLLALLLGASVLKRRRMGETSALRSDAVIA